MCVCVCVCVHFQQSEQVCVIVDMLKECNEDRKEPIKGRLNWTEGLVALIALVQSKSASRASTVTHTHTYTHMCTCSGEYHRHTQTHTIMCAITSS